MTLHSVQEVRLNLFLFCELSSEESVNRPGHQEPMNLDRRSLSLSMETIDRLRVSLRAIAEAKPADIRSAGLHVETMTHRRRLTTQDRDLSGVPSVDDVVSLSMFRISVDDLDVPELFPNSFEVAFILVQDEETLPVHRLDERLECFDFFVVERVSLSVDVRLTVGELAALCISLRTREGEEPGFVWHLREELFLKLAIRRSAFRRQFKLNVVDDQRRHLEMIQL